MRFAAPAVVLGSLAYTAAAVASPVDDFMLDMAPMEKRQMSSEQKECHTNCGRAYKNSAQEGYCQDKSWTTLLDGCLKCALRYDIWKIYGSLVSPAAEKCGLDATPRPVDGGAAASSSPVAASTTAIAVVTSQRSQASPTPSAAPTAQSTSLSKSSGPVASSSASSSSRGSVTPSSSAGSARPSTAPGGNNATTSGTRPVTGGASRNMLSGIAVAGAVVAAAAAGLC